jgi:hypothetical protein
MKTATLVDDDPAGWGPVTKFYETSDGHHYAITVDGGLTPDVTPYVDELLAEMGGLAIAQGAGQHTIVVAQTHVVELTKDWVTRGDTVEAARLFPPGVTHEEALDAMGYKVKGKKK